MRKAIPLRAEYTSDELRKLARASDDANQTRRLLALASIYDGGPRSDAAKLGGVTLQIVRDWVMRFNAEGPDGLINRKAPGQRPILTEEHRAALFLTVAQGPDPERDDVVRWRQADLVRWLDAEFGVSVSVQTLSRELRALGLRKLTARPRHYAQDPGAIVDFKKTSPAR